ncbi:M15 family metallopeptidase [Ornithinimicrobium pratense]|uniref:M15 family metallopeptidase n=1 Tax=Ornithinimicrobium pratense TaxID=2593973 RepID=A0A5J6V2X1_9MICO|nr:M15 family metallopeptidase [Ornithinimicrobium pratense]QFG68209.1 M15 family metallopeptidase [Ornithinimicrobium pratense]
MSYRRPARSRARRTRPAIVAVLAVVGAALVGVTTSDIGSVRATSEDLITISVDGPAMFADEDPAVAKLDPALLSALRQAAQDAAGEGVQLQVNSGWRSAEYQEQLLREAILEYGSAEEAARWVATPGTSAHVSGDAVDIGPWTAAEWLSEHGAGYGLCQIYRNEPWHYELRPEALGDGCPPMYDDPTQDPRMQQ